MKKCGVGLIGLVILFGILIPNYVNAETIFVSTQISADTTWHASNVYVIDSDFHIPANVTLTIEPGTVVKAKITRTLGQGIHGNLVAKGTSEAPIYFTSWSDDSVGGDTNGDGPSISAEGEWQGLYFREGSTGSLDYVNVLYSGYGSYGHGDHVGIENDGGNVEIENSNIHDNYKIVSNGGGGIMGVGTGVLNKRGTLSITDSVIENNVNGILIDSGTATISNNQIKNNTDSTGYSSGYGIYAYNFESLTLLNNTFSGNKRTALINLSKSFVHEGNQSTDKTNRGFEINGTISEDTVFHSRDLPLIINSLNIEPNKTLTLEPGTILKMNDYYFSGSITIKGNLIAKGSPDKKIYITSLRDDSAGGDTNGDGEATVPAPRNWNAIFLENGSKADFENVIVRYSGYNYNGEYLPGVSAAIYQRGAEFSVSNSIFEKNTGTSIFQDAGTTTIEKSELKNENYSLWSRGGSIKISQSILSKNLSVSIYNERGPTIDARNNWWEDQTGPHDISTSTVTGDGSLISGDILYIPFLTEQPNKEKEINPVIIIPGIMGSASKNGKLVIDPILHTYDDLIATLEANGYQKDKTLFTFPYEWRDSNVLTANLLKNKIEEVKTDCLNANISKIVCTKVDLVAHSMGGLVARELIQSGQYQKDVDQLIFLGTPHKGSADSYITWEAGEFRPDSKYSWLIKIKFGYEATRNFYSGLFDYIHNRPISSLQELLPIFDYLKEKETGEIRNYPTNYPRNIFLEALNTDTGIQKLLKSGVKINNIIGNNGDNTINKIRISNSSNKDLWEHGEPDNFYTKEHADNGLEKGSGDGTVTIQGATLDSSIENEIWDDIEHQGLPRETSARIFDLLTGKKASEVIVKTPIEKIFSLQLQSPIDIFITAPDGKRMGKNFETGEEYNEIPDAFYSGYQTEDEYITIPNPLSGEYQIQLQGTGDGGEFGVLTNIIDEEGLVGNQYNDTIKAGEIIEKTITINAETNSLSIEVEPTLLTSEPLPQDTSRSGGSRRNTGEVLGVSTSTEASFVENISNVTDGLAVNSNLETPPKTFEQNEDKIETEIKEPVEIFEPKIKNLEQSAIVFESDNKNTLLVFGIISLVLFVFYIVIKKFSLK